MVIETDKIAPVGSMSAILEAVVGDGRMNIEQRIAAAAALSVRSDPEARGRLRIALDACADEPVRVAIEKVLDGDLEAAEIEAIVPAKVAARAP